MGIVFVVGGFNEFLMMGADSTGWKILHAILGVVFLLAAIWCFVQPEQAFWALASVLGFLLLMMGIFEIIAAVATQGREPAVVARAHRRDPVPGPRVLGVAAARARPRQTS